MKPKDVWQNQLDRIRKALESRSIVNKDLLWIRQKVLLFLLRRYGESHQTKKDTHVFVDDPQRHDLIQSPMKRPRGGAELTKLLERSRVLDNEPAPHWAYGLGRVIQEFFRDPETRTEVKWTIRLLLIALMIIFFYLSIYLLYNPP
ncbi:MAG: hypothetical protein ACYS47_01930 [Planctomycetota bacterium]